MSGFASLELQIISINLINLSSSIWSWFKSAKDQQLEKISNFSVSDELALKDLDWLKTVLSWIVVIRIVIDRILLLANIVNIYTTVTRRWQNLLIFWMVLSLLKDIVLEVVIVIITFLQWHKGSVSSLIFVEFVVEKTIWLAIFSYKWWTILKWYMQLRREAKIRRFAKIARRSIASIINVPGRIGHSLDDECLHIATGRRDKYASLLNLNRRLTERSSNNFDLRISKSLATSITNDDSRDSNDDTNSSSANDLSVAEKSMKILGLTAEDVMDACARIQERSYWNEREVTAETPSEAMKEVAVQFFLEEDGEEIGGALEIDDLQREKDGKEDGKEINDVLRSKQATVNVEKAVNCNLMNEVVMRNSQVETEKEDDSDKIVSIDKKEQSSIDKKREGVSSTKSGDVTFDKVNDFTKAIESPKFQEDSSSGKKKRDEAEKLARIERCPLSSAECKNARNMKVKPCTSLVRKLEEKLRSSSQKEKWLDQVNQSKHSYQVKLTSTGSGASKKECHKNCKTSSCAYHRALKKNTDTSRKGKYARSTDTDDKNVRRDIDREEFKLRNFVSVSVQKSKMNEYDSAFKYSEAYRLKKRIQKFEGSSTRQTITWGSMSLAQTARSSGYAKDIVTIKKPSAIYRGNIRTEACDESSDSLNARYRSVRSERSIEPRSIYNASFKERNYARPEKRETNTYSDAHDDLTCSANKRKMRRRHDLSPNRKLSNEERETVELKALRAFNELTLLEDKKKLEAKKNRDLSLNHERPMESEVSERKVFKSHNDLTSLAEQRKMNAIGGHNLSFNCKLPIEESSASKIDNETSSENKKELKAGGKNEASSKYENYEKNVETSTSSSNHLSEVDREEIGILPSETRRNADRSESNHSRQAYRSLNLREITRNIEWTVHPRGITLTNKNLHRQVLGDKRPRESRQRDIIDDSIAGTLHSAFFSKPEIVTRVFRRAQTRFSKSLLTFPTFWRQDFNTEFACRVNNETVVQWDPSSFDLERIPAVRSNLASSSLPGDNRVAGENNRDLCIIFVDREQASNESETAIIEDSTVVGSQEDELSSIATAEPTNILLVCVLRDSGVEVSEESDIVSSVERIEEYGDTSNMAVGDDDFSPSNFNANDTSLEEEDDDKCDRVSLRQQLSNSNDNCSDDVASSVNLDHDKLHNLPDKKYIDTIDVSSEKRVRENNSSLKRVDNDTTSQLSDDSNTNQFDTVINKSEKGMFNRIPENVSQLSFPDFPSLIQEVYFNGSIESSSNEELQKLKLSESEATLENRRKESVIKSATTNYDTMSQSENVETLNLLETTAWNDAENEDRDTFEEANLSSSHRFSKINKDEWLRQDDSFYSMYERDNDSVKTTVSVGDRSLMEEFSNNSIPLGMSSNTSIKSSVHS